MLSKIGTDIRARYAPPVDAASVSLDAVALAGAALNGSFIDLGSAAPGAPTKLYAYFNPAGVFAGGTSVVFSVEMDADGVAGSGLTVRSTEAVTLAKLNSGDGHTRIEIPSGKGLRYLRLVATPSGTFTGGLGKITAWIGSE